MSNKEHIWIPRLKQQLADRLIGRREFIRYSALLGMSAGAAYMWAGRITGQPLAPPARAAELPKGGVVKVAMRIPKLDNPAYFLMDLRLERGPAGQWLSDPHRRRQRHAAGARLQMGGIGGPQDLDLHHCRHQLA